MNGYDRTMAAVRGEPMDFVPRVPILMQFAAEYIGSNYGAFASDYRVLVEANLRCAEDFGFDQVSAISDPYRETAGFGAEMEFVRDGVPRCRKAPLEDARDLSLLARPSPYDSPRMRDRVRAVESFSSNVGREYSILGWVEGPAAEAADLRGVTWFLMDLLDDPSFAEELMDLCVDVGIEFATAQIRAGADTIGVGDAICSQLSPDVYAQMVLPHQQRLVNAIHAAGGLVRLHICGNITHLLPSIADLGVDVCDCDWQVDMAAARQALGPGMVLTGNLDPVSGVKDTTPAAIREAVATAYGQAGNPYMAGAGCEIPPGTPNECLRALCTPLKPLQTLCGE